eukprot:SAG31_NODE_992_length_10517_cov_6.577942_9_plen_162_part_00
MASVAATKFCLSGTTSWLLSRHYLVTQPAPFVCYTDCRSRVRIAALTATPTAWSISKCCWTTAPAAMAVHLFTYCSTGQWCRAGTRSIRREPTRSTAARVHPAANVQSITPLAATHSRIRTGNLSTRSIRTQSGLSMVSQSCQFQMITGASLWCAPVRTVL